MRKHEADKDLKLEYIEVREMTEAEVDSVVQFYFTK